MTISPQSLDMIKKIASKDFNPKNLPTPSAGDSIEDYLAEEKVVPACPGCGSTDSKKNGRRAGRQRFRCSHCGRTFGYSSGTHYFRSRVPYSIWREALQGFERRLPLREIAESTGVSLHSLCRWRQRYLAGHLRMLSEIVEEMQAKGLIKEDAELEAVFGRMKEEIDKVYRGRSLRVARERLYRLQQKIIEKYGGHQ